MAALLGIVLALASAQAALACELEEGPRLAVARVVDVETLRLDDGREVRLIGALAPRAFDTGAATRHWPAEEEARAALERLVLGRTVELAFARHRLDRYGRLVAHVFVVGASPEDRVWVQGALLEAGHARSYALPGAAECQDLLRAREDVARTAGLGLWRNAAYAIRDAARPFDLLRHRATFQIVEGRVRHVAKVGSRIYLNFGDDWRRDFTIGVRTGRSTAAAGAIDWPTLEGARVRVRGWIDRRNGPFIELHAIETLQVLEAARQAPAAQSAEPPPSAPPAATPPGAAGADATPPAEGVAAAVATTADGGARAQP